MRRKVKEGAMVSTRRSFLGWLGGVTALFLVRPGLRDRSGTGRLSGKEADFYHKHD